MPSPGRSAKCATLTTRPNGSRLGASKVASCSRYASCTPVWARSARRAAASAVSPSSSSPPGRAQRPSYGFFFMRISRTRSLPSFTVKMAASAARRMSWDAGCGMGILRVQYTRTPLAGARGVRDRVLFGRLLERDRQDAGVADGLEKLLRQRDGDVRAPVVLRRVQHREDERGDGEFAADAAVPLPDARVGEGRGAELDFDGHGVLGRVLVAVRSEEHTSELQSQSNIVCRLLLEK